MQKAPEPLGFEGFLHSVWEGGGAESPSALPSP